MNAFPEAEYRFSPYCRLDRLIGMGRLTLGGLIGVDLITGLMMIDYERTTVVIFGCYFVAALSLVIMAWRHYPLSQRLQIISHGIELVVISVLRFLNGGADELFFIYFTFLMLSAMLRWQWRGTFWTALGIMVSLLALRWHPAELLHSGFFEGELFFVNVFYLAVMAVLLGFVGVHEGELHRIHAGLAHWPRFSPVKLDSLMQVTLAHAADILGAHRVLFVWEDEDEPWLYLAEWERRSFRYTREKPEEFGTVVDDRLARTGFISPNIRRLRPVVLRESDATRMLWEGSPLEPRFRERFGIGSLLCVPVMGTEYRGHLMALDLPRIASDDLVLGGIVAHEIAARLDHHFLLRKTEETVALEERVRFARDLHDGVLQSLTGAALHLETARRLISEDPDAARQQIVAIQEVISVEQRALRAHVLMLKSAPAELPNEHAPLSARLEELVERIRRLWRIETELVTEKLDNAVPEGLARDVCFIVHESLINAIRHAGASSVRVNLVRNGEEMKIMVSDNGRGFPFRGRHDHESLNSLNIGPVTLKERIATLGGRLTVDSGDTGSCLEISLPLKQQGG